MSYAYANGLMFTGTCKAYAQTIMECRNTGTACGRSLHDCCVGIWLAFLDCRKRLLNGHVVQCSWDAVSTYTGTHSIFGLLLSCTQDSLPKLTMTMWPGFCAIQCLHYIDVTPRLHITKGNWQELANLIMSCGSQSFCMHYAHHNAPSNQSNCILTFP